MSLAQPRLATSYLITQLRLDVTTSNTGFGRILELHYLWANLLDWNWGKWTIGHIYRHCERVIFVKLMWRLWKHDSKRQFHINVYKPSLWRTNFMVRESENVKKCNNFQLEFFWTNEFHSHFTPNSTTEKSHKIICLDSEILIFCSITAWDM